MAAAIGANLVLIPLLSAEDTLRAIADSEISTRVHGVLMLVNCIAVAGIGVLCLPIFRERYPLVAFGYLSARMIESIVLIIGILAILTLPGVAEQSGTTSATALLKLALDIDWHAHHIAMVVLGLGSLSFLCLLPKERFVPRVLATLGLAGYTVLAATSLLGANLSVIVTLPVFVFEVWFGIYLLLFGFRVSSPAATGQAQGD